MIDTPDIASEDLSALLVRLVREEFGLELPAVGGRAESRGQDGLPDVLDKPPVVDE